MRHINADLLSVWNAEQLVRMLTDATLPTIWALVEGHNPTTTTVCEAKTPDRIYGFEDQDVQDAVPLME